MSNFDPNGIINLYHTLVKEASDNVIDYGSFKTGMDSFNWSVRNDRHGIKIYLDLEMSFQGKILKETFTLDKRDIIGVRDTEAAKRITEFLRRTIIEYLSTVIEYDLFKNHVGEILSFVQ